MSIAEQMEASAKLFGHEDARLYPLLSKQVSCRHGLGVLCQIMPGEARVVLYRLPGRMVRVSPAGVKPDDSPRPQIDEGVPF